jgi:hypothetical protein
MPVIFVVADGANPSAVGRHHRKEETIARLFGAKNAFRRAIRGAYQWNAQAGGELEEGLLFWHGSG